MSEISIIVPCYNVEKWVGRCLDSLIGQTMSDIEIICIDDKSTDNTLGILKQYADADKRISIIEMPENRGVAVARNMGLAAAKSPYIGFIDPDDYIDADFYEKLYNAAVKSDVPVAKAAVTITNCKTNQMWISDFNEKIAQNHMFWTSQFWSALYKHDFLKKNNINFPDEVITGQDSVFLTHVTLCTDNIVLVNDTYYHYFLFNEGSLDSQVLTTRKSQSKLDMIEHKLKLIHDANLTDERKTEFIKYQVIPNICYEIKKKFRYKPHKKQMFDMLYKYNKCPEHQDIIRQALGERFYEELGQNKMFNDKIIKLFKKEQTTNGRRHIYLCGVKIFSYNKKHKKSASGGNIAYIPRQQIARYCGADRIPTLLRDQFYQRTGKLPTEELITLNEKIIWASMFDVTELKTKLADKYTVREYVENTIGNKYLIKLIGVWDTVNEVKLDNMPQKFVLKHSEGCGKVYLVPNKNVMNLANITSVLRKWAIAEFWTEALEMQYKDSARKFIAEEYVDTKLEYKLWCFGGKCKFIKIEIMNEFATDGKPKNQTGKYFFPDWSPADFRTVGAEPVNEIPKPKKLDELIQVAEKLATPFDFVRVDFFETNDGELKFGEMTFSPAAGNIHFDPETKNVEYGALFKLPPRDKNGFAVRKK
ncbi:MAG: glycosyltransferase [Alphaproteobacteria bacterium]|nr:glycosyltransferase [Alphaproteobacteria bacterium]